MTLRILLSNDDGVDASGMKCLERIARTISDDVWIVAPECDQSGASHSLSLTRPIRYRSINEYKFAVDGTPTDCILMALLHLIPPPKPTLILSGVNCGGNVADDVTYSGTIAAAVEGTLHGIPSIALSQFFCDRSQTKWKTSEHYAPELIRQLVSEGWPSDILMNINFPDVLHNQVKGVSVTYQGRGKPGSVMEHRVDPRGNSYSWITSQRTEGPNDKGSDISVVADGYVSLTPLKINLTDLSMYKKLPNTFNIRF